MNHLTINSEFLGPLKLDLEKAASELEKLREKTCRGPEWTGWFDFPKIKGFALAEEIEASVSKIDCDCVAVVGIGGSYLGTRAVHESLRSSYRSQTKEIFYGGHHLSQPDLFDLVQVLKTRKPAIVVISKSGTTTEPAVAFRVLRSQLSNAWGTDEFDSRVIAITNPHGGALSKLAAENAYPTYEVPDDIGGRYSVLSAVGLLPLALSGVDVKKLLNGADLFFREVQDQPADHPCLSYAAARYSAHESGKAIELLAYTNPRLNYLVEWWKQLFGESEGKEAKGLFPSGFAYTTDLHSLGQLAQDGRRNLFETFLVFNEQDHQILIEEDAQNYDGLNYLTGKSVATIDAAAMQATRQAHFDGGVPSVSLTLPRLDETSVGYLLAFFQTACAVSAAMLGLNPFDQPGVEVYKRNLFKLLGKPE